MKILFNLNRLTPRG